MDEAVALVKQLSRNYAKKQMTWFQRDPRAVWIDAQGRTAAQLADEICVHLESKKV